MFVVNYSNGAISSITTVNSYNITSLSVDSSNEFAITFKCNFTTSLNTADYIPLINADGSGTGQEISGVYNKGRNSFLVDFSNYEGKRPTIGVIYIFVFGRK